MNNNKIIDRHLASEVLEAVKTARIVNIIGPRQAGKTTLVREILDAGTFITLDDTSVLAALEADPIGQLRDLKKTADGAPIIIDEAQRSTTLALAIKQIVDNDRRMGQFILTGSSNVFRTAAVADSLAGRVSTLKLWPLSVSEIEEKKPSSIIDWALSPSPSLDALTAPAPLQRQDYIGLVIAGGYPEIRGLPLKARQKRYRDYVDDVVDRDVADILKVRKSDAMRRLIDQMAVRTANEINIAEICEIIGVQRPTMEQYLDVLTRLSLVIKLGAWTSGESRREIKNAKYHFIDSGIACALRGFTASTFAATGNPTALGGVLESFVFSELLKAAPFQEDHIRFYHWRGDKGKEVDILAEGPSALAAIEVKASTTVTKSDFKNMAWFSNDGPGIKREVTMIIFYFGEKMLSFGNRQFALPLSSFWAGRHYSNQQE